MPTPDHADSTSDDQPVKVEEALDASEPDVEPPSDPSDQPALPDFNP
jgi:hypothetical protein